MKKSFTNEQIIYTLRQVEGGTSVAASVLSDGHHRADLLSLEKKFDGMGVAELARLRQLRITLSSKASTADYAKIGWNEMFGGIMLISL